MTMSRREVLGVAAAALLARRALGAPASGGGTMRTRPIPRTGEELPVIGMGTWRTFDVEGASEKERLREVLRRLFEAGGRVIDSSPMYGRAEQTVGELLGPSPRPFLATKVWTSGRDEGIAQMRRSMKLMWPKGGAFDLMQIHNLVDWRTHVRTLREWKDAGTIRYWGITHYTSGAFDEMEQIVKKEKPDFVQIPYSVGVREAEDRLLPACADARVAVLVERPFEAGSLLRDVMHRPLPSWAAEIDCTSWAQILLKWILGHPAVTCPIPATSNPEHMADDVRAGSGRLPDEAFRRRIVAELTGGNR
ncbi:MAG: aldo/keto reductase [Myxococcales bacterium]|jgi:diketogulonate reductase-like aldo/keto reductase